MVSLIAYVAYWELDMNSEYLRHPWKERKEVPYHQLNTMPWDRQKGTGRKEKGEEGRESKRGGEGKKELKNRTVYLVLLFKSIFVK